MYVKILESKLNFYEKEVDVDVVQYAIEYMDYRMLCTTVRPFPSNTNRAERMVQAKGVVVKGPVTKEFHEDEKYYNFNSGRHKRQMRKSDKVGFLRQDLSSAQ